jgi:hypothetical protein
MRSHTNCMGQFQECGGTGKVRSGERVYDFQGMRLMIQKCLVLRYNTMGEEGIVVPRGNRELEYLNSIMEDMTEADVDMLGCAEFTDENMVAFHSAGFKEAQDDARRLGIKSVDEGGNIPLNEWNAPWLGEVAKIEELRGEGREGD